MAISSVQNLFQERKFPFIFALSVLLFCVIILLFTNTIQYPLFLYPDTKTQTQTRSISLQVPVSSSLSPPPPSVQSSNPNSAPTHVVIPPPPENDRVSTRNNATTVDVGIEWKLCKVPEGVDYIPCLDNYQAIKALRSRKHMEHRERHCPSPSPRCLVPLPSGYKVPVSWPNSRDMIWYDNVPHSKLVEYKKDQNWVRKSGDYFVFPGGGTQFKEGVANYIKFIEKTAQFMTLPLIKWGKHVRVILDVGCGVASFGGALLDKNVLTMSFAPKDEHEAQIQFALERGIPATLSVIGTQRLTFPDNAYDLIHCARCRVHWDADGGKPLLELNRILRPGGFFVWSATPVYRKDETHQNKWKAMVNLTNSLCWKAVARTVNSSRIGVVIFQKPASYSCYEKRKENSPPICDDKNRKNNSWYVPLSSCLSPLPGDSKGNMLSWPVPWPKRLKSEPISLSTDQAAVQKFYEDTKHWSGLVSDVYLKGLSIEWSSVRNVMDMNAGYGGFAAALIEQPLWVMNVVSIDMPDTLSIIFDRGLIGVYHDWCESFNTYPRTMDLVHSSYLFGNLSLRCDMVEMVAEMDRMLRPGGYLLVQDTVDTINKLKPILQSLHWSFTLHQNQFLVGKKGFWRPTS
ncbi:putative methyltransferase PMT [Parasponia andersonii]|uniref:Methyltransferase n=1 Tax=Parasponia andersonii TaxID=3476 RepID=A0A2P5BRI3_PARAD|nr:putative methyltransferase PMT [Parasponia andersonii]